MKPKIGWLVQGHAGTGGGRANIITANELMRRGYDVRFYSFEGGGIDFMSKAPTFPMEELDSSIDVLICGDMGRGHLLFSTFADHNAKVKIWNTILFTDEFRPAFEMKEVIKIATTNYFFRELEKREAGNVVLNVGPSDCENFFPLASITTDKNRANLNLIYAKKAGYVGPLVAKGLFNKGYLTGALAWSELGDGSGWDITPFVNLSIRSHRMEVLNFIFNISSSYIELCGAASWGFNYTLAEAMRGKCPVICSDWEGFDHLVINDETALTFPSNGAPETLGGTWMVRGYWQDVVDRVVDLNSDQSRKERIVKNAYELVSSYNVNQWVDRLEKLF